jgi:chaperone BCS1
MNMEAAKGILAPLRFDTESIQDTLVCIFGSSATADNLRYAQKLIVVGGTVGTALRASISAWNGFVDCSYLLPKGNC